MTERQEVLRLALWSRRQLLAQQNGWEVPQEPPAVQAGEPPFAAGLAYLGANPLRRAKDLCVPPGLIQSDCFDIVARVSRRLMFSDLLSDFPHQLAGPPNQSFNKITLELTDYTPVPGGAGSAHSLRGQEDELEAGILLRTLLWQNEAPDEVVTETMALLQTPNAVFLFRGLRVRLHAGFLNGSGRLNKAEFDVSILDEADPLYAVLAE